MTMDGKTIIDAANAISAGLARAALAARVNGAVKELNAAGSRLQVIHLTGKGEFETVKKFWDEAGGVPGMVQTVEKLGPSKLAEKAGVGVPTLMDIASELAKPGRDPREELPPVVLRSDVLEMSDLKPGMKLKGTVRNVIDFGAFVDIGVHQDGLVHVSQIANRFIKHPSEVLSVGDIVDVVVLDVDPAKKRISLSIKQAK